MAKWLGANVILWGIATACTAAAHNYPSLLAARIFLGIFEAAIAPCLILISSQWYTKSEAAPRFSIWYAGLGVGQIIGGIVSYAFQQVKNPTFSGWKIMFIVLGLVTVIIGAATLFILPDTPMQARFLSEAEKVMLLKHVAVNQTGIRNKKYQWSQALEILTDIQLWLMLLLTILVGPTRTIGLQFPAGADSSIDIHIQWCHHNLFGDADSEFWLQTTTGCPIEHAVRPRLYSQHVHCWLWRQVYV